MRFSIRDLLWATLVVAMGLGWWLDRASMSERHARELEEHARFVKILRAELEPLTQGEWTELDRAIVREYLEKMQPTK